MEPMVVGQRIWIYGPGWWSVTVTKLLPDGGVEVKWGLIVPGFAGKGPTLVQFDKNGIETDESWNRRVGGPLPYVFPEVEKVQILRRPDGMEPWPEGESPFKRRDNVQHRS